MNTDSILRDFNLMGEMEKQVYFTYMEPFFVVDDSFYPNECSAHDQQ